LILNSFKVFRFLNQIPALICVYPHNYKKSRELVSHPPWGEEAIKKPYLPKIFEGIMKFGKSILE
jgi:hypothetical protein